MKRDPYRDRDWRLGLMDGILLGFLLGSVYVVFLAKMFGAHP